MFENGLLFFDSITLFLILGYECEQLFLIGIY